MLELRKYPKAELSALFGTRDTQGLKRKLERYGIVYEEAGRGNTMTFDIKEITDPFKILQFLYRVVGRKRNASFGYAEDWK